MAEQSGDSRGQRHPPHAVTLRGREWVGDPSHVDDKVIAVHKSPSETKQITLFRILGIV
jgi:hypothetical protein